MELYYEGYILAHYTSLLLFPYLCDIVVTASSHPCIYDVGLGWSGQAFRSRRLLLLVFPVQ